MKYKLLVLDLDGTLLNSQKRISAHTQKTLLQYQKAGGRVVLASGRPTYGVEPLAKKLKLAEYNGFILSFNGACILDCSTGNSISRKTLPLDAPAILYRLAKENEVNIITYDDENIITENDLDVYVREEARLNQMKVKKVESFIDYVNYPVAKCIMTENGDYLAEVEKKIKAKVGDFLSVYRSETFFLEIMPQNVDKAASLEYLLKYLEIPRKEMIACGDGYNDVTMVAYAGLGVAMKNAAESVKEAADYIAPANDEDGVAHIINKFCLSED